jgi:cyclase
MYLGGGHTDGDSVVRWHEKNVVHMGDLYMTIKSFPFIDRDSGGDVYKLLRSYDLVLSMIDDQTKVIPGHGPMSNKAELLAWRATLGQAVSRVEALRKEGKTLEQAVAAKPLAEFNREGGFISGDAFVKAIWNSNGG